MLKQGVGCSIDGDLQAGTFDNASWKIGKQRPPSARLQRHKHSKVMSHDEPLRRPRLVARRRQPQQKRCGYFPEKV